MAVVNELVTKFTFKGSLKPLKEFQDGLKSSIVSIGKYGAALGVVATATAVWANNTLKGTETLVRLSQDTDISIQKLQQLQLIAASNGVTADSFTNSITELNSKIGEAATQGSEDFNRLGVSVRDANGNIRSSEEILLDLNKSFKNLSQAQQINFAKKLGIDQNLITAFNKSDEELAALTKRASKFGLVTADQTKELDKYYASIETLRFGFTAVSRQVTLKFAPVLQGLSNNVTDFLAEFGTTFATVFAEFIDGVGNLLSFFNKLIESTIGWKATIIAIGAAVAVAFPVTAIVGAITLILVAIEDLITAFEGGKSVIADFFKESFGIDIVETSKEVFNFINAGIDLIIEKFRSLIDFFGTASQKISGVFSGVADFFGFGGDEQPNNAAGANTLQPLAATTNNRNIATNNNVNNQIKIEVKSNDPEAAGQAVSTALNRELEQASFQYGKGGR
jgi:hypothetical protein